MYTTRIRNVYSGVFCRGYDHLKHILRWIMNFTVNLSTLQQYYIIGTRYNIYYNRLLPTKFEICILPENFKGIMIVYLIFI